MSWFDRIFRRKKLRRAAITAEPFPGEWEAVVGRALPACGELSEELGGRLRGLIQVFVAEKRFLGLDGVKITDEIKVTVAAPACLLICGIPELGIYPRLREIIVRPGAFGDAMEAARLGGDGGPAVYAGQAWRRGPVVLSWDSVRRSIGSPCDGFNVIIHEFAHVLDQQAGLADGAPPLGTREQRRAWAREFSAAYAKFMDANRRGKRTMLDPYGATNPAEFFAVVTENFFERGRPLQRRYPEMYEQLKVFFRQDPAVPS